MKRSLLYATLVFTLAAPVQFTDAALMRNAFQSCAFGAGAMAGTTYMGLTPALGTGLALPVSEVIAANALIGCGIGVAGATAATLTGWLYDILF